MPDGRIIRTRNSFYYVQTACGLITCKRRGRLKRNKKSDDALVTGDFVDISILPDGEGVIERRLPRNNVMKRPPVANVDQVVLTFAAKNPDPHPLLVSRFLVLAEWAKIPRIVICVNKMDLITETEDDIFPDYENAGYDVIRVSSKTGMGIKKLRAGLVGRTTVFAGPSGVGKSSLLNALDPRMNLQTGDISSKIKRGRHTTRVAQLIPYAGGYVADTPGFSSVEELLEIDPLLLPGYFPEFHQFADGCRFHPCTHSHEPDCSIKSAVEDGKISRRRYDAYLSLLEEITEARRSKYRL